VAFYEIMSQMWVRNGLQIKGQAMTYIQCHFSNSMVDADIFLLQLCSGRLEPAVILRTLLDRFHVLPWLSLDPDRETDTARLVEPVRF
jgi:E3 ubiquitin-protein ligase UBR3